MADKTFNNVGGKETFREAFYTYRSFYITFAAAIVIILIVSGLGLRSAFRSLVLYEAERDAMRICDTLRDSEIQRFISSDDDNVPPLLITPNDLPELDRSLRVFLVPFDIVKIKIFNADTKIIYSTDSAIIGKLDRDNAKLNTALAGNPISKYESKDEVWDLEEEQRKNVEIVETYIPIRSKLGNIIGSFEVYKDVTRDLAMADRMLVRAGLVLAATVFVVFVVLMFVIQRSVETIHSRTLALASANIALHEEVDERRRLEKELLSITEKERRRIGQELHDSIGQQLTGIEFMSEVMEQKLSDKFPEEASYAAKITALVNKTTDQTRELARGLHPLDLDAGNLMSALEELASTTEHLFGVSCVFQCDKPALVNDTSVAINLFRIAQEAVTNAVKHGKAKNIEIRLTLNDDRSILSVQSDGLDFPENIDHTKGIGLKIMQHRAEIINGTLSIGKAHRGGTILTCIFSDNTGKNKENDHVP